MTHLRSRRLTTRLTVLVAALTTSVGLAACGSDSSESASGLEEVVLAYPLLSPSVEASGNTSVPMTLGYFEDEGVSLKVNLLEGSSEAVANVVTGDALLSYAGTPSLIAARETGQEIIGVASTVQGNSYRVMVPEDSDLQSLADFEGRKIGILSTAAAGSLLLNGLMVQEGLDPEKVDFIPVPGPAEAVSAIEKGQIDAYMGWDIAYATMEALGMPLRELVAERSEQIGFIGALAATPSAIEDRPDALVKMLRAMAKGTVFMKENPEAAVRMHWEVYPETKPAGMSDEEAMASEVAKIETRLASVDLEEGKVFDVTEPQIESLLDALSAASAADESVQVSDVWDPQFIEEVNDFDYQAVVTEAKEYEADS